MASRGNDDSAASFIATIGYVRSLKIDRVAVWCNGKRAGGWQCHHDATLAIDGLPDDLTLRAIAQRLRCEACGTRGGAEVAGGRRNGAAGWMMPPGTASEP
jgi:hypothetical protein